MMQTVGAKKRVGIIRGGKGENYAASLKRGGDIISHIFENLTDKYKVVDILIDKEGSWHLNGLPVMPADLINKIDVVWNTAHPSWSETLNNFSIPHISSNSFSHALENSKEILREHMAQVGVLMPRSILLPVYQKDFDGERERYSIKKAKEVHAKFPAPWIVKSFTPDTNMGIHLAKTFNELVGAIEDGVKHEKSIVVEEFITGKVASMHSVKGFRMGDMPAQAGEIYTFPLVDVFGSFSMEEKEKLIALTKNLYKHIGTDHYLKSNFILNQRGKVYLLDVESTPNLKSFSHFAQACEKVGAKMHHVVEHILKQAAN